MYAQNSRAIHQHKEGQSDEIQPLTDKNVADKEELKESFTYLGSLINTEN